MESESLPKGILRILRYLDARRPITSKEVDDILDNKELSAKFLKAMKEARAEGMDMVTFKDGDQVYTIELVKDLNHLQPA